MTNKIIEALQFYYYLKPFGYNKLKHETTINLSVFASPRGGSTWLAETLKSLTNATLVWEPLFVYNQYKINNFNPFAYPERQKSGMGWHQYIPEHEDWSDAKDFFDQLFSKKIVNLKLYRFNDLSKISKSETFIFKFCFGNNVLPWLVDKYEINPVLLVRHPCAVVASQLNYGAWDWHKTNFKYNYNMVKFKEFYEPYREVLDTISCIEERLAAEWAMTVLTPIKNKKNDIKWVTSSYEDLLLNPNQVLSKIKDRYHLEWDEKKLDKIIQKQSFTKSSFENSSGKKNKLESWKNNITSKQIDTIINFTQRLGVDFYSTDLEPDYSKIYKKD